MTHRTKLLAGCFLFIAAIAFGLTSAKGQQMPTSPFAPAGQMSDPMQRGTTPFYPPNDPLQARPNAAGVSLNTRDMKSPTQPMSNGIMRTQYEEHIPGGTTTVLPSGDPLAAGTPPTNDIEYRTGGYYSNPTVVDNPFSFDTDWTWQVLPSSIIYKSYLASLHESRMGGQLVHINNLGNYWDGTLGGRAGILRYGTSDPYWPEGFQLDIEGAAFPRLNTDHDRDLDSVDYRVGIPLTMRVGMWQTKFGYYHLSSHMGDEFLVRNNTLGRINYVRETLMFGVGLFLNPNFRLYSEIDYAFHTDGGSEPLEFQFGAEYSPIDCDRYRGCPFLAVHGHLHQEVSYGGSVSAQIGWQWRGRDGHLLRTGFQYFNGMSEQAQVYTQFEQQYGWGLWYDF
jgi:hypothetical protein